MISENEVKNPIPDTGDENLNEKNKNEEITISILNKNNTNETCGNEVYLKSNEKDYRSINQTFNTEQTKANDTNTLNTQQSNLFKYKIKLNSEDKIINKRKDNLTNMFNESDKIQVDAVSEIELDRNNISLHINNTFREPKVSINNTNKGNQIEDEVLLSQSIYRISLFKYILYFLIVLILVIVLIILFSILIKSINSA